MKGVFRRKGKPKHSPLPAPPSPATGWSETLERARDAYWIARKNNKTENEALSAALDAALADPR